MVKVITSTGTEKEFNTVEDAILYVSAAYETLTSLFAESESFNSASCSRIVDDDIDGDEDCDPFDNGLRFAHFDGMGTDIEWRIENYDSFDSVETNQENNYYMVYCKDYSDPYWDDITFFTSLSAALDNANDKLKNHLDDKYVIDEDYNDDDEIFDEPKEISLFHDKDGDYRRISIEVRKVE